MDQQTANQMSQITHDFQNVAYVFGMAIGCFAEIQSMIAANKERLAEGKSMAYDEAAFIKVRNDYGLYHNSILTVLRS